MNVYNPPGLTKEGFWNEMQEKYPRSMGLFCKFIDQYKETVDWNDLFNDGLPYTDGNLSNAPKYHDLPIHFQFGIWVCFIESRGGCHYDVDLLNFDLKEEIARFFNEVLEPELTEDPELYS